MKTYFVYILASGKNGTLYIGVTSDLAKRIGEHRSGIRGGFAKRYGVTKLVYHEETNDVRTSIEREKHVKKWNRAWKIRLIESMNPGWKDLFEDYSGFPPSRE